LEGFETAVARQAIKAVQFQMLGKRGQPDEAFESGFAHLCDILEFHVVCDESENLLRIVIGKMQAMADSRGHLHTDFRMAIETDAVPGGGCRAKRGWLANVVEEHAPGECRGDSGGQAREHQAGMNPDVTL